MNHERAHCKRDPAAVGACGGSDDSCSCECFGCMPENRPDYEPEVASEQQVASKPVEEVPRYYEAFGPRADDPETKRLENIVNRIVHDVLTENPPPPVPSGNKDST